MGWLWRSSALTSVDTRRIEELVAALRVALLLLAGQPCQPQLVMDPDQRVHRRSLIMIRHHQPSGAPAGFEDTTSNEHAAR